MRDMYQFNQIPSEAQIRKFLRRIIFGKNIFCPGCRLRKVVRYETRYRCKEFRMKFSLLSYTWLSNMKLPYERFWLLLWAWTTAIPVKQARTLTHLSEKTVRYWFSLFRAHLPRETHVLERIVHLDEAYFHHYSEKLEEYVREFCFRFSSPELFENPRFYLEKTLSLVPTCI